MRWRRTEPVQEVGALLLIAADAADRVRAALANRSGLYAALMLASGTDWAALFAAPLAEESEAMLPRIAGAAALYRCRADWWFPVGTALEAPDHVQDELLATLAARNGIAAPAIAMPRFAGATSVAIDVYHARDLVRVGDLAWPQAVT